MQLQSPFSQIRMLKGKQPRGFFGGVDELGKPGSICLHMYPSFKKAQELQVHSDGVTCLEINFEQNLLFCGGADGSLAMI